MPFVNTALSSTGEIDSLPRRAHPSAMSITAIVENGSIKLPPGVHVPDGTRVEITLPAASAASSGAGNALNWMMKHAGTIEGPGDFAAEHDHYIHGTPKRTAP